VYVYTDQVEEALEPLSRVFGLVSLSPVQEVPPNIEAIVESAVEQARGAGLDSRSTFRVRARRSDKSFAYTSPEIDRMAGAAVVEATGAGVDLSREADVTIGVEVRRDKTMVYARVVRAPGGLPVGIEGRVVALISGGIDSPVAAWLMMKRGCSVIPLHFAQSEVEKRKALDNIEILQHYSYGWELRPTVLSHQETIAPTLEKLRELGRERWSCVFCKRTLVQKACELAGELGAHAVVMGDALGQVASQTLANMEIISYGMPKPILRPLIGLDKTEIVEIARQIGTFEISTREEKGCPFLPDHPLTRGSIEELEAILQRL
jgi:thiamine biosynthesis protein ThiI